jgi:hypothetical protein
VADGRRICGRCEAVFGEAGVGGAVVVRAGGGAGVGATAEDVSFGEVGPAAFVVKTGKGANGAKGRSNGDLGISRFFDEAFDDDADILAANNVEASGAGVTVDGIRICKLEIAASGDDVLPVEVGRFDGVIVGMAADLAFAAVAFEAGDGGVAFGGFGLGGAAERAASGSGRGDEGGSLVAAALGFVGSEDAGVGFADAPKLIGAWRKALSGEAFIVLGALVEDDIEEAVGEDGFDGRVLRHGYFLL